MNLKKHIIMGVAVLAMGLSATAQDNTSSSSMVRRGGSDRGNRGDDSRNTGVSTRMQTFYHSEPVSEADMQWMRIIYRQLDLKNPKNAPLYYPEDLIDGQENLFRMMMRLVADGQLPAYEYLDGREIFNDQYRLNVRDMLDRFHILYTDAKGSTEKNPKFVIEESDVPTNEVLSYYILERWQFDSRSNRMKTTVEAICPVLHRAGDFGSDGVKYPMFWVKLDNLRPHMAQQYIFVDDDNNLPKYTYDDFFAMNMYDGDIYKTRNLMNKSMMQLYPDPDEMKRAQDSIQHRLDTFDKNIWVPSREEVIAAREAREKGTAAGDSIVIPDRDTKEKPARSTRSRAKAAKEPKAKDTKVKESKIKSSSGAARSVRRTRR